jgi:hypothetical protein
MLIDFRNYLIIDPSQYRETLAVRFLSLETLRLNGRCGVYKEKDNDHVKNSEEGTWLTSEEDMTDGFQTVTVLLNRPSMAKSHAKLNYAYTIYMTTHMGQIFSWTLTLIEILNEPWRVAVNFTGSIPVLN